MKEGFYLRRIRDDYYLYLYEFGVLSVFSNEVHHKDPDGLIRLKFEDYGWFLSTKKEPSESHNFMYLEGLY